MVTDAAAGQLKRELGLFSCISLIIGSIIGTGIFVSPSVVLASVGSVELSLVVWVVCGLISILGALTFVELGLLVPESGAEYSYLLRGFKGCHPYWGPLPSFLACWMQVLVLRPAGVAIYCLIFAEYGMANLAGSCLGQYEDIAKRLVALCALGLITGVNMYSVRVYVRLQAMFTCCKLLACLVVLAAAVWQLSSGTARDVFSVDKVGSANGNPADIVHALYGGLYAFGGWSALNEVTEEVVKPERNILLSILIGLPLVTFIYCFMNLAYLTVLTPAEMVSSSAVAVDFGARVFGVFYLILPLGVMVSAFGSALNAQFAVARFCYAAGREGHLMSVFSYVHVDRVTPVTAVLSHALFTVLFIVSGDVLNLIGFLSFISWIFYCGAMVALIMLKTKFGPHPRFKTPIILPVFVFMVGLFLSLTPIIAEPQIEYLTTFVVLACGMMAYTMFVYNTTLSEMYSRKITRTVQLLGQVLPPDYR